MFQHKNPLILSFKTFFDKNINNFFAYLSILKLIFAIESFTSLLSFSLRKKIIFYFFKEFLKTIIEVLLKVFTP